MPKPSFFRSSLGFQLSFKVAKVGISLGLHDSLKFTAQAGEYGRSFFLKQGANLNQTRTREDEIIGITAIGPTTSADKLNLRVQPL